MDALTFPWEIYFPKASKWSLLKDSKAAGPDAQFIRLDAKLTPIRALQEYADLKAVTIGHASQSDIEFIAGLPALTCVRLAMPRFASLAPLRALRGLTALELNDPPSLSGLESLVGFECLVLRHFRRVKNLAALGSLVKLQAISMSTIPSWDASRRCLEVESLRPLGQLRFWQSLSMIGVNPLDGRLDWLEPLTTLKFLHISHVFQFQLEDYAALARALPEASGHCLVPYYAIPQLSLRCKRCGGEIVFITGPRPRARRQLCPICDERKLQAHEQQWQAALKVH